MCQVHTYMACFPCYPATINLEEEDDYTTIPSDPPNNNARRNKRDKVPPDPPRRSSSRVPFDDDPVADSIPKKPPDNPAESLLMSWHLRLGHLPFPILQQAATLGILPRRISTCAAPRCPGCLYGKAKRKPWRSSNKLSSIAKKATRPGDCVSVDQLISSTPGLIAQSTGKLMKARYKVATIFVDHASGLDFVHLQETTNAKETVEAKDAFERFAKRHGVTIKHYHADNGIFASKTFRRAIIRANQTITFCGVNAHHQNGVAERRIRDLSECARAMLLHARHRNPKVTTHLWPYALRHASELRRCLPRPGSSQSPLELFARVKVRPKLTDFHQFGCPVYVLSAPLQAGKTQPKWIERARVGIYLGLSPSHATSVSLILNPITGLVSPQFHCVYDDDFATVAHDAAFSGLWRQSVSNFLPTSFSDYSSTDVPSNISAPWFLNEQEDDDDAENSASHDIVADEGESDRPHPSEMELAALENLENPDFENPDFAVFSDEPSADDNDNHVAPPDDASPSIPFVPPSVPFVPSTPPNQTPKNEGARMPRNEGATTRSGRQVKLTTKMVESSLRDDLPSTFHGHLARAYIHQEISNRLDDGTPNIFHPLAYAATLGDPDTMTLAEAMKQEDKDKFIDAMEKEVHDHVTRKHWRIASRQTMRNSGYKGRVVMAIWSMKRKRSPSGEITKYKARLCVHGGQTEKGVHYESGYSPVVSWSTIRLLLILSEIHEWKTRQVDFVLAFPQAPIKTDVYMEVPNKFRVANGKLIRDTNAEPPRNQPNVLKLLQNLYGLVDASATWHEYLKKGLKKRGFIQSKTHPCLFVRKNMIVVTYVDDCLILCPDDEPINAFITSMQKDFTLTDEGTISAYLGIQIEHTSQGIKMSQPGLIKRIIEGMKLKDARMHDTPADKVLHKDTDGEPRKCDFHYRSAVGQLNYLTGNTRPEMAMATHQCARFSADPKLCHEQAIKRIIRYLKRTPTDGLTLKPDRSKGLECYVDADFAGGYSPEFSDDASTCFSRTGYVISYAGCPIIWASKMQTTIALSTTEAEYIALSASLREVIYLINLLQELHDLGVPVDVPSPIVRCKVFEDNVGALEIAKVPKMRPRTKHLCISMHHFREYVSAGKITLEHVSTTEQTADIMTKPLPRQAFLYLRKKLCGW
jgi:hypothetical protein